MPSKQFYLSSSDYDTTAQNQPLWKGQKMSQAKNTDKVTINFIGKLDDGTIIDSTYPDPEHHDCSEEECGHSHGPVELIIGEGELFGPIEEAVIGMTVGETKTLVIPSDDAFGEYNHENVFTIEASELPEEITPEIGMELEVESDDEEIYFVTIVEIKDGKITLDSNHPLAGENITYDIELLSIA
jgi:peptidylprolyl isomerase